MADGKGVAAQGNRQSGVTPERWKQVEALFEQALEIPAGRTIGVSPENLRW